VSFEAPGSDMGVGWTVDPRMTSGGLTDRALRWSA